MKGKGRRRGVAASKGAKSKIKRAVPGVTPADQTEEEATAQRRHEAIESLLPESWTKKQIARAILSKHRGGQVPYFTFQPYKDGAPISDADQERRAYEQIKQDCSRLRAKFSDGDVDDAKWILGSQLREMYRDARTAQRAEANGAMKSMLLRQQRDTAVALAVTSGYVGAGGRAGKDGGAQQIPAVVVVRIDDDGIVHHESRNQDGLDLDDEEKSN